MSSQIEDWKVKGTLSATIVSSPTLDNSTRRAILETATINEPKDPVFEVESAVPVGNAYLGEGTTEAKARRQEK